MGIKKTNTEFLSEVKARTGNEYTFLEAYKNNSTKINVKHEICGNVYSVAPVKFLSQGRRCPFCNRKRITKESMQIELDQKFGISKYTLLSDYITQHDEILVRNNTCNHEYNTTPYLLRISKGCKICNEGLAKKKENETFLEEVYKLVGSEYTFLENYKGKSSKIKVRHNSKNCNNFEYYVTPNNFLSQKNRCPYCNGGMSYDYERFLKLFNEKSNNGEYELISKEYKNTNTKVLVKHNSNKCNNNIFAVRPRDFLSNGTRCPICKSSKGEKLIKKFLDDNNIKYEQEFTMDNCRNIRVLPFDFKIGDTLVEFDGLQHYKPSFGIERFISTKNNDKIKDDYCKEHGIKLVRIKYTQINNIEKILENIVSSTTIPVREVPDK